MMAARGSTLSLYRPTGTKTPSGFAKFTWPTPATTTGIKGLLEPLTADIADRVFGSERRAQYRIYLPAGTDIREHDGLLVTAGNYAAKKFQVLGPVTYDVDRRADHIEVALLETTEAFGV